MASPTTLNVKNLEALGAERLAALLIELSTGNAAAKRRLRIELAGSAGPAEAAQDIRKRLATIAKARSFVDSTKVKALAADIAAQHRAINDHVAPTNPGAALDLFWQLMACANPVLGRSDDNNGHLTLAFDDALPDLGRCAVAARTEPLALADRAFESIREDIWGLSENLIENLSPALGRTGLLRLQSLVAAWQAEPKPPEADRQSNGSGTHFRPFTAEQLLAMRRGRVSTRMLANIADALGDVDAYIALFDPAARTGPSGAAAIARRLLDDGRAEEALAAIAAVDPGKQRWLMHELDDVRIDALDALGRADDAQAQRRARFDASLEPDHLRAWLARLPEFDDFDAERQVIADVVANCPPNRALSFLIAWPALDQADRLVIARAAEWDGNQYQTLSPAADALESPHPLAATLLRRAMIDFTLKAARTGRYKHAARHLADCGMAARRIEDWQGFVDHAAYLKALFEAHRHKTSFWAEVD